MNPADSAVEGEIEEEEEGTNGVRIAAIGKQLLFMETSLPAFSNQTSEAHTATEAVRQLTEFPEY